MFQAPALALLHRPEILMEPTKHRQNDLYRRRKNPADFTYSPKD